MNSISLLPIIRKSDRLKAIWWKQLFIKIFDLHFLVHRYVYGTKVDAAHSWQIDGKKMPGPPAVCVGCPWVEWHFKRTISEGEGRGRTSKERSHWWASQAWTQERRGKGGREGREGRGMRRRERVWEGTEEEWMRNKREGWRQWGVKLDSYFIEYITQNQEGGDVCLMFDSTNIFVACFWWTLPDFTSFSSLIDKIICDFVVF